MEDELVNLFISSCNDLIDEYSDKSANNFIKSSFSIWKEVVKKSSIHDKLDYFFYEPSLTVMTIAQSDKINNRFMLGFDLNKNQLFMTADIRYWQNIRNLSDEFLVDFFSICNDYGFVYSLNGRPVYDKTVTPEFSANYKSNIINMMHCYVSGMLQPDETRDNITFGNLSMYWDSTKDAETIINELEIAFKWFYKFNYHLWKSETLRVQNRENRKKRNLILPKV